MNRKLVLAFLSAFSFSPLTALAQPASIEGLGFEPRIGDWQLPYEQITNSVKGTTSTVGESLGDAISRDPRAYCADVALGSNSAEFSSSSSSHQRGTHAENAGGGGGGSFLGIIRVEGGGESRSSDSWDNGRSNSVRTASSTVVQGRNCANVTGLLGQIETARMNSDTQRLGILVNNETQRYGVDKQAQVALKQIQAGQIQNVFGNGARSMMGDMVR
ncbi:MAG: hypothetical protein VKK62_11235 [Synechococcaceae cyanobacterium]|jgi:hypothetical protein|nr:hypothetical protein [Synechococcaceae cyanobacterium]